MDTKVFVTPVSKLNYLCITLERSGSQFDKRIATVERVKQFLRVQGVHFSSRIDRQLDLLRFCKHINLQQLQFMRSVM